MIGNSLYNTQHLDIKDYKHYRPNYQENKGTIQLDYSKIRHLSQFKFDVDKIDIEHYQRVFFKIVTINNSSNEEDTFYYKCEAKKKQNILSLSHPTWKYISSYRKLESPHTLLITMIFSKIDRFSIYFYALPIHHRYHTHRKIISASVVVSKNQAPEAEIDASSSSPTTIN